MAPWLRFLFLFGFLPAGFAVLFAIAFLLFLAWVFDRHFKDR